MQIEITIAADIVIDENKHPNITPDDLLKGVVIRNSDVVDGFELTTNIDGFDNTVDFFLQKAKITKKSLINNICYFLVYRKCADTWHVGYLEDSEAGMISIAPTSFPVTYNDKQKATKLMNDSVIRTKDSFALNEIYEFDRLFDKNDAIKFVKQYLKKEIGGTPKWKQSLLKILHISKNYYIKVLNTVLFTTLFILNMLG